MRNQSSVDSVAINLSSFMDNLIVDTESYREYMTDLNYSQGFYVTPSKDGSVFLGGIRQLTDCTDKYRKGMAAARFAVEEENKKRGEKQSLKFIRIVNLNYEPSAGAIYYVTLAAEEYSGEVRHFQAKIREKLHTGYLVQIFRVAPYCANSLERVGGEDCCIWIDNLQPWMDESYLFYKCFFMYIGRELSSVKIIRNEKRGDSQGYGVLRFTSSEAADKVYRKYDGKRMPHSNQLFKLENAPRN